MTFDDALEVVRDAAELARRPATDAVKIDAGRLEKAADRIEHFYRTAMDELADYAREYEVDL